MDQSLKRSISSLDLAPDARAAHARRSAQPSDRVCLHLKDTGIPPSLSFPPSRPAPQIDERTLSNLEVLLQNTNIKSAAEEYGRSADTLAQLLADRMAPEEEPEEFRKGKGKSGGAQGEGFSDKRAVALEARERLGLPPAEGWKKYDTTHWEQEGG